MSPAPAPLFSEAIGFRKKLADDIPGISSENRAGYQVRLGVLYQELGRDKEAEKCFTKSVELAPENANSHNALAWFRVACMDKRLHDYKEGLSEARKAIELAPGNGMYWHTLGVAQYRSGD